MSLIPQTLSPFQTTRLRRLAFIAAAALTIGFVPASANGGGALASFQKEIEPILDQFCYDCHGFGSDKGGVILDGFSSDLEIKDHGLWLRALRNVRAGIMPPNDEPQPSEEQKARIVAWIKEKAFELNPEQPDPGRVTVRRLNRVEYRNTVRDLMGVDFDTSLEFPGDDTGHGFDNNADVLTISPMLLEKYLDAAQAIVARAVPVRSLVVDERDIGGARFLADGESGEDMSRWIRHLSYRQPIIATATHTVSKPGDYEVVVDLMAIETYVDNQFDYNECLLIFRIDGEVALEQRFAREGWQAFSFAFERNWAPGERELSFEIVPLTPDQPDVRDLRFQLNKVTVRGPMAEEHWVQPRSYARFFPEPPPSEPGLWRAHARKLLEPLVFKAFRRPVDGPTLDRLAALASYVASQPESTFEAGMAQAIAATLASPRFLFREEGVLPVEEGERYPLIDEYALASRLSYFFWSTMPDAELFALAEEGALRKNLDAQVRRLLADSKASGFVKNFAGQWLQARDIESVPINGFDIWLRENPNPELEAARTTFRRLRDIPDEARTAEQVEELAQARNVFFAAFRAPRPNMTDSLRRSMQQETELYFEYILNEDRSLIELIESDYTFLNEDLAKHYAIEGVYGDQMRKVELPEGSVRGGVLTQGTLLAVTSNPDRTSPVKRGVFLLENILGTPPAPPPPNIPALEDVASPEELREMSLRETLELHARRSECRSCHLRMDPLGLALENFNAMGVWRESEMNRPVEVAGQLITGETFSDIRDLKRIIANERRRDFFHCFAEKLMTYALGRSVEYYDTDTLDHLVEVLEASEGRPSALLMALIESAPFQRSRPVEVEPPTRVASAPQPEALATPAMP